MVSTEQPLLILSIDIGNQNLREIRIFKNDDPEKLANKFISENGLSKTIQSSVITFIQGQLETLNDVSNENEHSLSTVKQVSEYSENPSPNFKEKINYKNEKFIKPKNINSIKGSKSYLIPSESCRNSGSKEAKFINNKVEKSTISSNLKHSEIRGRLNIESISKRSSSSRPISTKPDEIGCKMYKKSKQFINKRNKEIHLSNEKKILKENHSIQSKPQIHSSKSLSRSLDRVEEGLLKWKSNINKKRDSKSSMKIQNGCKENLGKPIISYLSKKIAEEINRNSAKKDGNEHSHRSKSLNTDCFDRLYQKGIEIQKRLRLKKEESEKSMKFIPQIINYKITNPEYLNLNIPATQRLFNNGKAIEEKLMREQNDNEFMVSHFDQKTGQPLFQPVIFKSPVKSGRPKQLSDFLYKNSKVEKKLEVKKRQKEEETLKLFNQSHVNKKSIEILNQCATQRINELFSSLDNDVDGKISKSNINLQSKLI